MGLAASQARFLAITARKMNCEFQSMQIAQQKLSVTRDLQKASEDYQTKMNATKLVWESMDGDTYDLTYDIMMQPTAINQYDPYLVTDTQGRIVLSKAMFDAAFECKMINENGEPVGGYKPSLEGRNDFLEALGVRNLASASNIQMVEELEEAGYTRAGIGGVIADKSMANALTTSQLISYLQNTTWKEYNNNNGGSTGHDDKELMYGLMKSVVNPSTNTSESEFLGLASNILKDKAEFDSSSPEQFIVRKNGQVQTESQLKNLTLGDLLSGKYELVYKGTDTDAINKVLESIAKAFGWDAGVSTPSYIGLNVDKESNSALDIALELTKAQLNSKEDKGGATISELCDTASEQNRLITGSDGKQCISLTNIVKSFLTNFAIAIDGFVDADFFIDKESSKKSKYVTNDLNYYFFLSNDAGQTSQAMLVADFYNMLYNQICTNGACTNSTTMELAVNDSEYLTHALKNGQLFISSLNNDGYFYQGAYTLNGHVAEVPDEDARARAELEYNVTKSKLNYKEETLELQMKNLDMEISSLTTEFDTVKNLISKGIEKVFTMFSS